MIFERSRRLILCLLIGQGYVAGAASTATRSLLLKRDVHDEENKRWTRKRVQAYSQEEQPRQIRHLRTETRTKLTDNKATKLLFSIGLLFFVIMFIWAAVRKYRSLHSRPINEQDDDDESDRTAVEDVEDSDTHSIHTFIGEIARRADV